jgi:hypothetical protein
MCHYRAGLPDAVMGDLSGSVFMPSSTFFFRSLDDSDSDKGYAAIVNYLSLSNSTQARAILELTPFSVELMYEPRYLNSST